MKSVTKLHRSSAIQAYRDLLVRDFHPLVIRAVRAHVVSQKVIQRALLGWSECASANRHCFEDDTFGGR